MVAFSISLISSWLARLTSEPRCWVTAGEGCSGTNDECREEWDECREGDRGDDGDVIAADAISALGDATGEAGMAAG